MYIPVSMFKTLNKIKISKLANKKKKGVLRSSIRRDSNTSKTSECRILAYSRYFDILDWIEFPCGRFLETPILIILVLLILIFLNPPTVPKTPKDDWKGSKIPTRCKKKKHTITGILMSLKDRYYARVYTHIKPFKSSKISKWQTIKIIKIIKYIRNTGGPEIRHASGFQHSKHVKNTGIFETLPICLIYLHVLIFRSDGFGNPDGYHICFLDTLIFWILREESAENLAVKLLLEIFNQHTATADLLQVLESEDASPASQHMYKFLKGPRAMTIEHSSAKTR